MQGIILEVDAKTDSGIIRSDDQTRYEFNLQACRNGIPSEGATVDFEVQEGKAAAIYILKSTCKAKLDWLFWFLFSFRGRISRDQFLVFMLAGLLVSFLSSPVVEYDEIPTSLLMGWIFAFYICSAVLVKRFHDSGTSAAWLIFAIMFFIFAWLIFTRILNLGTAVMYIVLTLLALLVIFCLYLCFAKGSIGSNRYGKEPYCCKTIRLK